MKRTRPKRSPVWDHFEVTDNNNARCKICDAIFKYSSSTTSLNYHLKSVHPLVLGQSSSGDGSHLQPTLSQLINKRKCDDRKQEGITQRISNMVTKDMLPLNIVDGQGFQELIAYVEPGYNMVSRTTITSRTELRYKEVKSKLKTRLSKVTNVALTTDCWTSNTAESYMTITCHWMEDWEMKSAVLLTEGMAKSHTADNLAEKLNEAVDDWGLTGRVIACVHDNARNIVSANSPARVNWMSVPCYAHTLQLAVNDGFALHLKPVIAAAGRLVGHFHHSTKASEALKVKQKAMGVALVNETNETDDENESGKQHKLIKSCKTRWNSVCDMFNRLVEQRWAVCAVLSDRTVTKHTEARTLELKDEHWQLMEDVNPVLDALKCATTVLSTEREASISNTYPITFSLINMHLLREDGDTRKVAEFKSKVASSLRERMKVWFNVKHDLIINVVQLCI